MKIQADLGIISDDKKHLGQIPDLLLVEAQPVTEKNEKQVTAAKAALDLVTAKDLTECGAKYPELLPAINDLLKHPRWGASALPQPQAAEKKTKKSE